MAAEPQLQGYAYPPHSSHREPARLTTRGQGPSAWLEVHSDRYGRLITAELSEVAVDPPLGSAPRKMTFPDGTVFETLEHESVEALTGKTSGSTLHYYEGFRPRLIGVVAVCLFAAWALWRYGLDILAAVAIAATPQPVIEQIDVGSMQTIDFAMAEPSRLTDRQMDDVRAIYRDLVRTLPPEVQEQHSFDLLFRSIPGVGPNAFALPGGTMVMTDAFVEEFDEPDVIAGVLGHEIGHIVDQHGLKRLYRSLGAYFLIAFLAGDVGPLTEDLVLEGNVLLSLSFSRSQEREADRFGLTLTKAAGYDPAGLKVFFEGLEAQPDFGWTSSHPSNADRIKAIDDFIKSQ